MNLLLTVYSASGAFAQSGNEKLGDLLQDRALYDAVSRLKTDDRIAMYATLSGAKPDDAHYQNQMAATYLQKMRETMDPDYLNRATKIVDNVLPRTPRTTRRCGCAAPSNWSGTIFRAPRRIRAN